MLGLLLLALASAVTLGCEDSDALEEVRRLQQRGDYQATIEPLRALLESRPDDPEVFYRYGVALAQTRRAGSAAWSLREAMKEPEWYLPAGLTLGGALTANGAHDEAIEVCEELLKSEPDNVQVLLMCANARIRSRRDYEGALSDADRILALEPDNVSALVPRAVALLALEREEEAAKVLERLDDVHRDESLGLQGSPGFCAARATFAEEREEVELAERRFDECLENFPDDGIVVKEAIEFFDANQRGDRSLEIIEKALEKTPQAHAYRTSLVLRLHALGRDEDAIASLLEGTRLDAPADVAIGWVNLAGFNVEIGRYDDAVAAYEKVLLLEADPSPDLLFEFADALVMCGRYPRALEIVEQMTVPAHRGLVRGRVHLERGDPEKALAHFEEGLRTWPNNAIARYYTAVAAERVGDFDRAIEEYRYAIRAGPSATDASLRLGRMYEAEGNDEKALNVLNWASAGMPWELEASVLRLRILARKRRVDPPPRDVAQRFSRRDRWALAAATRARGYHDVLGPSFALESLRQSSRLDLTDPQDAVALEVTIDLLAEVGAPEKGVALVRDALAARPEAAVFHALLGRALAHQGARPDAVRSAYERALELDATTLQALLGLAEIEAAQAGTEQAVSLCERAIEVEPTDRRALLSLAQVLVSAKRSDAAIERLEELLREHPYDARAAITLARLLLESGETSRARKLARRAVRFGGGAAAEALVETIDAVRQPDPTGDEATPPPMAGSPPA